MIDTIRLKYSFCRNEYYETRDYLINSFSKESDVKKIISFKNDAENEDNASMVFNTDYLNIYINKSFISVKTSLWKLFHGNNVVAFDKIQIQQSVDILQQMIPTIDWKLSCVNILHIGPSLSVKHNPDLYINVVTGKEKLTWVSRDGNGDSKSIGSKNHYTILYNKSKESKSLKAENVIRIEHRIESPYWFEKYFGSKRPTLAMLLDNLDLLYILWYRQYQKLEKDYLRSTKHISSVQDLFDLAVNEFGYGNCKQIILDSFKLGKLNVNQKDYAMKRIKLMKKKNGTEHLEECYATELDKVAKLFMVNYMPDHIEKIN